MIPSTQPQIELLVRLGIPRSEAKALSKTAAQLKLMELRSQPTLKQKQMMLRFGLPLEDILKHTPESAFTWIAENKR